MNELVQAGAITEIKGSKNVAYLLNDDTLFLLTEYKVLKSQIKNGFVRCAKLLYNGKVKLVYFSSGYKSLMNTVPLLDSDMFLSVMANLLSIVLEIKNNGFLSCQNLDLSFDKIFIDQSNFTVNLVYLPINAPQMDFSTFENNLRTQLIKLISSVPALKTAKADCVCAELANGAGSFNDLYATVCSICKGSSGLDGRRKLEPSIRNQPELIFSAMNAPVKLEYRINKSEFLIGKTASSVDGVIGFNKAVSRIHCKIIYQSGLYYLVDLGSANGTFINKSRIAAQQMHPIKNGDVIRLANSDFMIRI
jgi:hypothetical protein